MTDGRASCAGRPARRHRRPRPRIAIRHVYALTWAAGVAFAVLAAYRHDWQQVCRYLAIAHIGAAALLIDRREDPRMSKGRARFKLAELRQNAAETSGDAIEIETDDGTVFELPAPGFWDDGAKEAFAANNDVAGVKALMGPREYVRFRQAGGRADDVALALRAYAKEQGLSLGESSASPTS